MGAQASRAEGSEPGSPSSRKVAPEVVPDAGHEDNTESQAEKQTFTQIISGEKWQGKDKSEALARGERKEPFEKATGVVPAASVTAPFSSSASSAMPEAVIVHPAANGQRRRLSLTGGPSPSVQGGSRPQGTRNRFSLLSESGAAEGAMAAQGANSSSASPRERRRRSSMLSDAGAVVERRRSSETRRISLSSVMSNGSDNQIMQAAERNRRLSAQTDATSDFGAESDGALEREKDGSDDEFGDSSDDEPLQDQGKEELQKDLKMQQSRRRHSGAIQKSFEGDISLTPPSDMFAIPIGTFLDMKKAKPFEELKAEGSLVEMGPRMDTVFVAMQWSSKTHPDPDGQQLQVLQAALKNLAEGAARLTGDVRYPQDAHKKAELVDMAFAYVWIDFCCMSSASWGGTGEAAMNTIERTLVSLPHFVERSKFMIALAPPVLQHGSKEVVLDYRSLRTRGCWRLALTARALSQGDTRVLMVQDEHSVRTLSTQDSLFEAPCEGSFETERERKVTGEVLSGLINRARENYVASGRISEYRLLQATQHLLLRGSGSTAATEEEHEETKQEQEHVQENKDEEGLSSDDSSDDDDGKDKNKRAKPTGFAVKGPRRGSFAGDVVDRTDQVRAWDFLRVYGLVSVQRADEQGFLAMHFAAAAGRALTASSLKALGSQVEAPAEAETDRASTVSWPSLKGMTPLHLAARFGPSRPSTVQKLISFGAKLDVVDELKRTPLMHSCMSGNVEVVRCLIGCKADLGCQDAHGSNALHQAVVFGRAEIAESLLAAGAMPAKSVFGSSLLFDLALCSTSQQLVSKLTAAGCDVNEHVAAEIDEASLQNKLASLPSVVHGYMDLLAKQHHRMTPIMAAALVGNRQVAAALLEARADPSQENQAGLTALELARLSGHAGCLQDLF
mmetsp:Transcript_106969/g.190199  ORF Transcript_106969/g.190199 Transcript_106969/m.190199 type:complete len:904 (+) Transcript_106969:76-2787(+)